MPRRDQGAGGGLTVTKNVLLAFDGSDAALQACRLVAAYAGDRSALAVTLLNIQRPPLRLSPQAGMHHAVLETALREQGEAQLAPARDLLAAQGVAVQSLVKVGPPAETLLETAAERDAAMIVMGSGRHGVLGGYAVGSVALRVAPAAACPVVLVGPNMRLPAEAGRKLRVLAPVDGSAESVQAVRRLAHCAAFLGELHVDLAHFQPGLTLAAAILPPHDDVVKEWGGHESDVALAEPARLLAAAGISHAVHRLTGPADAGIADFAAKCGAEAIAMATRGTGAMHHLLLGSVALKTAHASGVPVALLR